MMYRVSTNKLIETLVQGGEKTLTDLEFFEDRVVTDSGQMTIVYRHNQSLNTYKLLVMGQTNPTIVVHHITKAEYDACCLEFAHVHFKHQRYHVEADPLKYVVMYGSESPVFFDESDSLIERPSWVCQAVPYENELCWIRSLTRQISLERKEMPKKGTFPKVGVTRRGVKSIEDEEDEE